MWRFNPFSGKDSDQQPNSNRLENRTIEVGSTKLSIKTLIAEGGFSSVYSARDFNSPSKPYAVKHIIINDSETLDLVLREIQVMKRLKGNPNVVALISSAVFEAGRFKEACLVMEFCERSLVGLGFLEEREILLIFRDVCNAVFAMHNQSPPIAHRDLKLENVLLGSDGKWKLCDFGSTSTNHKRFVKADEMGIEEDVIRKHTTPAYRAPEMWDLYRKDIISEKVDIWALGCLLYRICFLKPAFDGESKLQILNGNYKIPDNPKYSDEIIKLMKDLLGNLPNDRPDITQVWFRVNALLPLDLQKNFPDGASVEGLKMSPSIPKRTSPKDQNTPPIVGAFRSTHLQNSPKTPLKPSPSANSISPSTNLSPPPVRKSASSGNAPQFFANFNNPPQFFANFENAPRFVEKDPRFVEKAPQFGGNAPRFVEKAPQFVDKAPQFVEKAPQFVEKGPRFGGDLERELGELKEELRRAKSEKCEISEKYEKLSAICEAQMNELNQLRWNENMQKKEEIKGTVWELEQGMFDQTLTQPKSNSQYNNNDIWDFAKFDQMLTQPKSNVQSNNNDLWGFGKTPPGWAGF
ncbi:hypothetical protein LUZ60_017763 [Juncus effusus]|nr:hypothetical protein LUZ60_017763 [Juncus effusus]